MYQFHIKIRVQLQGLESNYRGLIRSHTKGDLTTATKIEPVSLWNTDIFLIICDNFHLHQTDKCLLFFIWKKFRRVRHRSPTKVRTQPQSSESTYKELTRSPIKWALIMAAWIKLILLWDINSFLSYVSTLIGTNVYLKREVGVWWSVCDIGPLSMNRPRNSNWAIAIMPIQSNGMLTIQAQKIEWSKGLFGLACGE